MKLTPSEIQEIFKRDIFNICQVNFFAVNQMVEMLESELSWALLFDALYFQECRQILADNISTVCKKYFTYRPEQIEDPLEHYKGIVSSRHEIEAIICKGLCDEVPEDFKEGDARDFIQQGGGFYIDPYKTIIRQNTLDCLSYLWEHLVGVGEVHKFDPVICYEYLYRKDETDEES